MAGKLNAIYRHEPQTDEARFPGFDARELWQRAENRTKGTAAAYNQIDLRECSAMEALVRWKGVPI